MPFDSTINADTDSAFQSQLLFFRNEHQDVVTACSAGSGCPPIQAGYYGVQEFFA
jgi:hypothetical protein